MWVLSVVDGSLEVDFTADYSVVRTSFKAGGGTVQNLDEPTTFTAAPWPANWRSRPLVPNIDTQGVGPRSIIGNVARAVLHRLLRKPEPKNRAQIYRSR